MCVHSIEYRGLAPFSDPSLVTAKSSKPEIGVVLVNPFMVPGVGRGDMIVGSNGAAVAVGLSKKVGVPSTELFRTSGLE